MKFKRRLIDSFLDKESTFNGYCHCFSFNNGEFKADYRSVFNTDFFPQLLNIAHIFARGGLSPWEQKTIILEDDDQRLTLNFKENLDFDREEDIVEEDKEKFDGITKVTIGDRVEIDVISDGDSDKNVFFYQIPKYYFCKNILNIIERDLDEYNKNIGKPDGHFRLKEEEVKTISKDFFLKRKRLINNYINWDLRDCIIDRYQDKECEDITKEVAENLLKEYNLDPLKDSEI